MAFRDVCVMQDQDQTLDCCYLLIWLAEIFCMKLLLLNFSEVQTTPRRKSEKMNQFVNNFIGNLSEEEKKLPFLTNHARALRAYQESSERVSDTCANTVGLF